MRTPHTGCGGGRQQQVIVISGRSDDGVEANALAAGAAAFLLKGGLDGEVAGTIRRVTTRRQR